MANQLDGLSKADLKEAKRKMRIEGRLQWWRQLRADGKEKRAAEYAATYKLPIDEELAKEAREREAVSADAASLSLASPPEMATGAGPESNHGRDAASVSALVAERVNEPKRNPVSQRYHDAKAELEDKIREDLSDAIVICDLVNGWPVHAEAEVVRQCRNKRLSVIRLPDGREAAVWNQGKPWQERSRIKVVLDECTADPIYQRDDSP